MSMSTGDLIVGLTALLVSVLAFGGALAVLVINMRTYVHCRQTIMGALNDALIECIRRDVNLDGDEEL